MLGSFEWKNDGAIQSYIDQVLEDTSADSTLARSFRDDLLALTYADQAYMLASSTDRRGRKLARLAPSTLANRRRGPGGPLDPLDSRIRSGFKARWDVVGGSRWIMIGGWPSVRFAVFHVTGTPRMPARDLSGWSPTGFAKIGNRFQAHVAAIGKSRSFTGRAGSFFRQVFRR